MPSLMRRIKTFIFRRKGPKRPVTREVDVTFAASDAEFHKETDKIKKGIEKQHREIDGNLLKIRNDLLKMRHESKDMRKRCERLDSDIEDVRQERLSIASNNPSPSRRIINQPLKEYDDTSLCSDDEVEVEESLVFSMSNTLPRVQSSKNRTKNIQSPLKYYENQEQFGGTLDRNIYRTPKTNPNSISIQGASVSSSNHSPEHSIKPVLTRYSLVVPERPNSSLMDYNFSTYVSYRHSSRNLGNHHTPVLKLANSETLLDKQKAIHEGFAKEVFEAVRKSIGDLTKNETF